MIEQDQRNAAVLLPYLNGDALNSRSDHSASRWVVNFYDWEEQRARQYPLPYGHVEKFVKPERRRLRPNGEFALRKPLPERWWMYADKRPKLYKVISEMSSVLAIALVSKAVMPVRVRTGQVFSHALGIFTAASYSDQAILSSAIHQVWAITYGSTLESRVRYTPSDVFETFPRPEPSEDLERLGELLQSRRRNLLVSSNLGLTDLYNLVNDPSVKDSAIEDIRNLHADIDRAVVGSYGWFDIQLSHGFHIYRQLRRFTISPNAQVELMERLLEENHRRAAVEGDVSAITQDEYVATESAYE